MEDTLQLYILTNNQGDLLGLSYLSRRQRSCKGI